jgi:hypothetical protein
MSTYEQLSTGKKIEALSLKVNQLQQEIAGLRQDVRTILSLLQKINLQSDGDANS